jgi:hypothetical protein
MILLAALLALSLVLALAQPAWADDAPARLGGRVVDVLGRPIAGANVHVVSRAGEAQVARTDKDGRYSVEVRGGAYSVVFAFRGTTAQRSATVEPGAAAVVDGELELGEGELIQIRDLRPPPVLPKPRYDVRRAPKYSDQAILSDAWAKAWLLLDVSAAGEVTRLKVLKRPGFDLERIALEQAFGLKFEPARDHDGRPVPTLIIYSIEWPSHEWLRTVTETSLRLPEVEVNPFVPELPALAKVPCAGTGPWSFGDTHLPKHVTYRDCSRPDLSKASTLPWVEKP